MDGDGWCVMDEMRDAISRASLAAPCERARTIYIIVYNGFVIVRAV